MALRCPDGTDIERLRDSIRATYEHVARKPRDEFPFNRGMRYAAQQLNYSAEELALVPRLSAARFVGKGNPQRVGAIHPGETVLDHGCGAGLDLIIAAHKTGASGRVIGIDATASMLEIAWSAACIAGVDGWTTLFHGECDSMPLDDASIDVVISNGTLNLAADKVRTFRELFRVLRPGGRLYLADTVVQCELDETSRRDPDLWAACAGGALLEQELAILAQLTGFIDPQVTERFDCYRDCGMQFKVPSNARIGGVNFFARKP